MEGTINKIDIMIKGIMDRIETMIKETMDRREIHHQQIRKLIETIMNSIKAEIMSKRIEIMMKAGIMKMEEIMKTIIE